MIYGPHPAKRRTWEQFKVYWLLRIQDLLGLREADHWSTSGCPHCSEFTCEDEWGLLYRSKGRPHTSMECVGTVHDWDERWQCGNCGTVYEFVNSDY